MSAKYQKNAWMPDSSCNHESSTTSSHCRWHLAESTDSSLMGATAVLPSLVASAGLAVLPPYPTSIAPSAYSPRHLDARSPAWPPRGGSPSAGRYNPVESVTKNVWLSAIERTVHPQEHHTNDPIGHRVVDAHAPDVVDARAGTERLHDHHDTHHLRGQRQPSGSPPRTVAQAPVSTPTRCS
jgi:hypothetical protein